MIEEVYVNYGSGSGNLLMWGLSPSDDNSQINAYKTAYGITNPCAGTQGGGPAAINIVTTGQPFLGYPTYCIICPDKSMFFDICWPPGSASCFDPYISDCGYTAITAGFTASQTEICEYDQVNFMDNSTGTITSWSWTFEGGDPATSQDQNPTVTYNESGTYDVELEVSDGTNTANLLLEDYIEVQVTPPVNLNPFEDVCFNWPPFELSGGSPAGGEYSGPGVIDGWFYPEDAGLGTHMITYSYTGMSGCENSAEESIYVDECVGIRLPEATGFILFPNPAKDQFTIRVQESGEYNVRIFNVLGKSIYRETILFDTSFEKVVDLSDHDNGIYFVQVESPFGMVVQKLRLTD